MNLTLVILAAGMGSRYGGLKQLDGLGPDGQTIMDYSVHDALGAGFNKIVFVIRRDFEAEFQKSVMSKYSDRVNCIAVFQDLDSYVGGLAPEIVENRLKPWGTAHAILATKNVINEPFAAINADDFYGAEAFQQMAQFLNVNRSDEGLYSMMGYNLKNTLSENGTVNRGICKVNDDSELVDIYEGLNIGFDSKGQLMQETNGSPAPLDENSLVSMNFWGFHQSILKYLERDFIRFSQETTDNPKSEYFIPFVVNDMMKKDLVKVKVIPTESTWIGVTYQEDRATVVSALEKFTEEGVYDAHF